MRALTSKKNAYLATNVWFHVANVKILPYLLPSPLAHHVASNNGKAGLFLLKKYDVVENFDENSSIYKHYKL